MKAPSQVTSLWSEFKSFAFKGNMIDLAVAVVIGAAFGDVIKSIVNNLIMPLVSYVTPSRAYTTWHIGKLMYGQFLGDLLTFLIVSFAVFITIVKLLGAVIKRGRGNARRIGADHQRMSILSFRDSSQGQQVLTLHG